MKLLMTASEATAIAFGGREENFTPIIMENTILVAQQKYILPAIGLSLYRAVTEGKYPDFVDNYLKTPLALYSKALCLPMLSISVGAMGVSKIDSASYTSLTNRDISSICRAIRSDADNLIREALDLLDANIHSFDEYEPSESLFRQVSISGGIIL